MYQVEVIYEPSKWGILSVMAIEGNIKRCSPKNFKYIDNKTQETVIVDFSSLFLALKAKAIIQKTLASLEVSSIKLSIN